MTIERDVKEQTIRTVNATIQAVFARNGVPLFEMAQEVAGAVVPPATVPLVSIGDRVVTLSYRMVEPEQWKDAQKLAVPVGTQLARVMRLGHSAMVPEIFPEGEFLCVQVPRPYPALVIWGDLADQASRSVILGRDTKRRVVAVDIMEYAPSFKVVGASGSGKTNALRSIAAQCARLGYGLAIACLKGSRDWADLISLANYGTAFDNETASRLIANLSQVRQDRERESVERETPLVIIWDEIATPTTSRENQEALGSLISLCRSANMLVIWGSQVVGAKIAQQIKDNATTGLIGRVSNTSASYHASDVRSLNAHRLQGGGDMYLVEEAGASITRLQTPRADQREKLVEQIARRRGIAVAAVEQGITAGTLPAMRGDLQDLIDQALTVREQQAPPPPPARTPAPLLLPVPPSEREALAHFLLLADRLPTLSELVLEGLAADAKADPRNAPPPASLVFRLAVHLWRYGKLPSVALQRDMVAETTGGKSMGTRRLGVARELAALYCAKLGKLQVDWYEALGRAGVYFEGSYIGGSIAWGPPGIRYASNPSKPSKTLKGTPQPMQTLKAWLETHKETEGEP